MSQAEGGDQLRFSNGRMESCDMPAASKRQRLLPTVTLTEVLSWNPCYSVQRVEELAEGRSSIDALGIMDLTLPPDDILSAVIRVQLLPCEVLVDLDCSFAERVLPIWDSVMPGRSELRIAIDRKQAWCAGCVPMTDLSGARELAMSAAREAYSGFKSTGDHLLHAAARVAYAVVQTSRPSAQPAGYAKGTLRVAYAAAKAREIWGRSESGYHSERRSQLEIIQKRLEDFTGGEDSSGRSWCDLQEWHGDFSSRSDASWSG